jgi:hypothetical protein
VWLLSAWTLAAPKHDTGAVGAVRLLTGSRQQALTASAPADAAVPAAATTRQQYSPAQQATVHERVLEQSLHNTQQASSTLLPVCRNSTSARKPSDEVHSNKARLLS